MKKAIMALALLAGTRGEAFSQSNADKTFNVKPESIERVFTISLGKGEAMRLELTSLKDLDFIPSIDSILRVFITDIEPLKDSLSDELKSRVIDYIPGTNGKSQLRFRQVQPEASSYFLEQGTVAMMKLEQDTLNILLKVDDRTINNRRRNPGSKYYRVSLFLNSLGNLTSYTGTLDSRLSSLRENALKKWIPGTDGQVLLKSDPSISSGLAQGAVAGRSDYLNLRLSADIQNYKNVFVPSISFGFDIITNRGKQKRTYSLLAESHFSFDRPSSGKLQSSRSAFLTVGYSQKSISALNGMQFSPAVSFGWLARQRGSLFDKNTFKIGFGRVNIFNDRVRLEPVIYFNDFFKNVSPGIRLSL